MLTGLNHEAAYTIRPSRTVTGFDRFIAYLAAYVDTLHVFIAGPPEPGDRRYLELVYGKRVRMSMTRRWNSFTHKSEIIGFTVKVQCPQIEMLELLGAWQRERGGTLRRLDLSFDWHSRRFSFVELTKWIKEHLVMRNRESGIMNTYESGGAYFVPDARNSDRSIDNLFYPDRVSKRDWKGPPVNKNELRVRGHENIERVYDVKYADEIPAINPAVVFRRCFDISQTFDSGAVSTAVQGAIRKNLRAERAHHARHAKGRNAEPSARHDRYRAMLPKRQARTWANRDLDYVQRVKDFFPRLLISSNDQIRLPVRLSWDATGSKPKRHV